MASTSSGVRRALTPSEIFTCIDSEDEDISDFDDDFAPESSADDGNSSADEEDMQAPKPKKGKPNPKDFYLWEDGHFTPKLFDFDDTVQGVKTGVPITADSSEFDVFRLFFDENMMAMIVRETNDFFIYIYSGEEHSEHSKVHAWCDTTAAEMYTFLATVVLMGHVKKMKMKDYWSKDPLIATPMFSKIMSSDRFFLLLRMLHFSSNTIQNAGRLSKISSVIDILKRNFSTVFSPFRDMCIDESLMLWKGRLSFRQYIPSKRHRFGIKLFMMCDCHTGFILDFLVYTGSSTELESKEEDLGKSGDIVLTLMKPHLGKGHQLFTDNWYTSPKLCQILHENKTGLCGTTKPNRKGFPKNFSAKMTKGTLQEKHTENILAVKWQDKRPVHMLSTINESGSAPSGKIDRTTNEEIMKPKCVLEYNQKMGLVDKSDMQISFSEFQRKSVKWYKKFFFHLLDLTIYNAFVIFKLLTKKNPQLSEYRLELARQILEQYHQPKEKPKGGRPSQAENPLRLTERHFPTKVPATACKKKKAARKCRVCSQTNTGVRQRRETTYMCKDCDVGLCIDPCFKRFHTEKVY